MSTKREPPQETRLTVATSHGEVARRRRARETEVPTARHRVPELAAPPGPVRALRIVRPDADPVVIALDVDRRQLVVGRNVQSDIVVDAERVSRVHGLVRWQDHDWWYEDLGSSNGSMIVEKDDVATLMDAESTVEVKVKILSPKERHRLAPGEAVLLGARAARLEALAEPPATRDDDDDDTVRSAAAQRFRKELGIAATTRLPVFLLGPSGVGKTTAARTLHERGGGSGRFVPLNCARLPRDDAHLHSMLLGHVKGGFTGAVGEREGVFLHALGGTLFLDEVESLPDVAQGFLLDVLEGTGMLLPLGAPPGSRPLDLRFRLIAASKAPLSRTALRPDLAQRLTEGHVIEVPSLRDRADDIPGLVRAILDELSAEQSAHFVIRDDALAFLARATWDGEVRALRSVVRTAATTARIEQSGGTSAVPRVVVGKAVVAEQFAARARAFGAPDDAARDDTVTAASSSTPSTATRAVNPRHLTHDDVARALTAHGGNITRAAAGLGVARNTLVTKMRAFGLKAGSG